MDRFKAIYDDTGNQVWIRVVRLSGVLSADGMRHPDELIMPDGGRISAGQTPGEFVEVSSGRKLRRV